MRIHEAVPPDLREKMENALKPPEYFFSPKINGLYETWSLGPIILTRDSRLMEKANHRVIMRRLDAHPEWKGDYQIVCCSHWGCGWITHLACKVVDSDGQPTEIFLWLDKTMESLKEYPLLDDAVFSELQHETRVGSIRSEVGDDLRGDIPIPEEWAEKALSWIFEHNAMGLDASGNYISREASLEACKELGYLEEEEG